MAENAENLILEHLRAIRARVNQHHDIPMTIQSRLTSLVSRALADSTPRTALE